MRTKTTFTASDDQPILGQNLTRSLVFIPSLRGKLQKPQVMPFKHIARDDVTPPLLARSRQVRRWSRMVYSRCFHLLLAPVFRRGQPSWELAARAVPPQVIDIVK